MRDNKVFKDADSAIESVIENVDWLTQDVQTLAALREAGVSILQGPGAEMKTVYTSAALSELHRLLAAAKKEILTCKRNIKQKNSQRDFRRDIAMTQTCRERVYFCA
ncbi:uncharacterized protein LOC112460329 [Temnothorax curvispinosus]|uniref:Uncharacterized protein LOC112460329 n=1 Tax=Temnothorax curvispinosus TaxID=300111 RepID=A0A6J1QG00_9HYME|nr:uncharacterized protein LOC112460329 [Temnothorax curvispinosus]